MNDVNLDSRKYKNPADYLRMLFRRKFLLIIPAYAGLLIGIAACLILPPTWQSSTIILVEEEKIINPLIQNLAVSTSAQQRMASIREVILGWNSLVDLAKKLGLDRNVTTQEQFESLILGLRDSIQVKMRPPNIIILSYEGKTPKETQRVAQTLAEVLIERNIKSQTNETNVAISFITEQLDIYKRKIKEAEIAELEDQLKKLLADSTEAHPIVKELRAKLAVANDELNSGNFDVKGGSNVNAATKQALEAELDKLIKQEQQSSAADKPEASDSIYKLMLMEKVGSAAARDINVNQAIYNMLLQRLETAKITQRLETSREGTRYTVLDPARLPLSPTKPKKPLIILLGLFAGLAAGVGLVFAREFMDQSILDIEDAKLSLPGPVLGAIPRITTVEEQAAERRNTLSMTVVSIVLGASLVVLAFLIALLRSVPNV